MHAKVYDESNGRIILLVYNGTEYSQIFEKIDKKMRRLDAAKKKTN